MLRKYLIGLFCLASATAFADNTLTLPTYYQPTCAGYTGTWVGYLTDTGGLFGDKPYPVTLTLFNRGNQLSGEITTHGAKGSSLADKKSVYAQCENGHLSHIFYGNKNQCGVYSETGGLIGKNLLALQLNYENAMINTTFVAFFAHKNSAYPRLLTKDLSPGTVKSCHE